MQFESLPGFREFYPEVCSRRNYIFSHWRKVARAYCFSEYDAPVLEPLELYIEKSGEEIVGQLFNFEDRGGRAVALRPEMTPSLARLIAAKANSLKRPVKWFNIGEHYRYERPQKGRLRAFYQFNVDIFGEPGPAADAELICQLVQSLQSFGLNHTDFKVRLSDRDLWLLMLASEGLDEAASADVLGIVDKLERTDRAKALEKLIPIIGANAEQFLEKVERVIAIHDFDTLRAFIESLPLEGERKTAAEQRLSDWTLLMENIESAGLSDYLKIDLGIVRGLAYYTGFVFEAFEASGQGRALAGGGRYDALVKKLGGPDMPAVGFAMGDVTLVDLLESKDLLPEILDAPDFMLVIGGPEERKAAMLDAAMLRSIGYRVNYPLKDQGFGKQFKAANQSGARFVLIYGADELAKGMVKVRDLTSGGECEFDRSSLQQSLSEVVENGLSSTEG
ncbi:histidine--tRNA ligase [Coraliomargarita sinensis]|uniref:Histidine--tRNA ligase n=1 Tax=Coraliomargarita sinensis TaxID=2174842 RepID=A0A317ZGU3_9BACT|nr:histidine--tRNA ligase [Coraliomargarita sinensis]PXA04660.1 histidine--tRNA ligase [Coraliomargarita sinensis]